jgi:HD-GYP domain-containing protein (c-di-GMP phosphodiesterase class II)
VRDTSYLFRVGHAADGGAVVLIDATILRYAHKLGSLHREIVVLAADSDSERALGARADLSLVGLAEGAAQLRVIRAACELAAARMSARLYRHELVCTRRDLHELSVIAGGLMNERDRQALLRRIVEQGKTITQSDAGCLFLLESDHGTPRLKPSVYLSDSLPHVPSPANAPSLPLDEGSIIGHAAISKQPLTIADAYHLDSKTFFASNTDFEDQYGYYVQSMLVMPMVDHRDAVVGVLAFVNRKRDRAAIVRDAESAQRWVLPYTRREVSLGRALAGVAATSIENAKLYARIETLLESVVKASVSAIDARDPTTAGHSVRVADLTTALATAVERAGRGRYRDLRLTRAQMRELRFAALLHDLGKVAVREDVLMKARKLPPEVWERVCARFDLIRCTATANDVRPADIDAMWDVVREANEPHPLACSPEELEAIARRSFRGVKDKPTPYLTEEELDHLLIPNGTLDTRERDEVESHVQRTHLFLSRIPWTDDLSNVAAYARGHHEKLDGSGYPRGLRGDQIPLQTRLITIADIFDALTASDRPYKKALPPAEALSLLEEDARRGQLDADLVRVLAESHVYEGILR